ncbi:MAG: T9SS type A sorting domain-containing protein [Ignavibacteriae bacterium]|nr:T9SS type A sorting domain-containing protein [Ignavibacteriota bacterium]
MLKRTFPYYDFKQNAYNELLAQFKNLREEQRLKKKNNLEWEFVGPTNIGGRVVDIEFNPQNPNIVYAAAATGGVFKSEDMGINWFPIFDDQPCLSIGDIGIDPQNPNVIYVGTGEANGGHNNFPGVGIFKSIDAGETWNFIGLDSSVSIGRILVDPNNSQKIWVAAVGSYFTPNSQRGIFLSEDGGVNWEKSLFVSDSTGAIDLVINPINSDEIFAAMWERVRRPVFISNTHLYGPTSGIYKTINGGKTWGKFGTENGLPNEANENIGRIGLSISLSNPQIIYATFSDGNFLTGIYKSIDSGENWIKTNSDFTGSGNFGWYFGQVRVHPQTPETIFVLDVPLLKSTNSGVNWDFSYGYGIDFLLHVDHHALAFHPNNPDYIISGNDGGINISQDGGITWSNPVQLPTTQFYEIGLDKNNPKTFLGGTQDNGTIITNSGNEINWERILGGDGFYAIVDPNNSNIIFAESQFGNLFKSIDGGKNFNLALNGINQSEPTNWSTPIVIDPNNSNVLYYGTYKIYRTINSAETWNSISQKLTDYNSDKKIGTISTIAISPSDSNVIYIGTDDGNIWVTKNYGITWEKISNNLPQRWVTRVAVHPTKENIVYATFSGLRWAEPQSHVYRSENFGESWQEINNGLPDAPVNAFEIDKINPKILYLGNDIGVFVSYDEGNNWEILGNNLPIVVINDMKIHPTENYLAIGTHGRGIFKLDLNPITKVDYDKIEIPNEFILYQNYPNPFNPTTTIEYNVSSNLAYQQKREMSNVETFNATSLQLNVFDVLGKKIKTLINEKKYPGNYKVTFNAENLPSGIYFYKLKSGKTEIVKKMVLMK